MKVKMSNENIPYHSLSLSIQIRKRKNPIHQKRRWHYHKELEFAYMQQGVLGKQIQDKEYLLRPGDVLVVGSSQPHCSWCAEGEFAEYLILHFDLQRYFDPPLMKHYPFFYEINSPLSTMNDILLKDPVVKNKVGQIMSEVYNEMEQGSIGYELAVQLLVKQLLLLLLRSHNDLFASADSIHPAYNLRLAINYVNENLSSQIDMGEVSQMMNMNYHYFSRYFKKTMGMSFIDYVNLQRIKKAERLLLTESANVSAIAEQVGISGMTHFYNLFRRYNNCSPKEYVERLQSVNANDQ